MSKALRKNEIRPEVWDELASLLAGGMAFHHAVAKVKIARASLANNEAKNPELKAKIREAAAQGARYRIDEAAEAAKEAKTKDQALMARIRMEAEARRAELIAPTVYGKASANLPQLPQGATASLTIRWANEVEGQPKQMTIEHKAEG